MRGVKSTPLKHQKKKEEMQNFKKENSSVGRFRSFGHTSVLTQGNTVSLPTSIRSDLFCLPALSKRRSEGLSGKGSVHTETYLMGEVSA